MFLFTQEEILALRRKATPELLERLKQDLVWMDRFSITQEDIGSWGAYYQCAVDSSKLAFDPDSPHAHRCPACGRVYSGEPYDSSWWNVMHGRFTGAARSAALLYLLTGEREYTQISRRVLLEYAKYYPGYPQHGNVPYNGPGKLFAQTITEASFLHGVAYTYDMVKETLSSEDRTEIEEQMLQVGLAYLKSHRYPQIHNHEALIDASIGVLALSLGDEHSLQDVLYGPYGLVYQLEQGTLEDGVWFEGSLGYQQFALNAFMAFEVFARHTQWSNLANPTYLKLMRGTQKFLMEDGTLPALNDCSCAKLTPAADLSTEFGYAWYRDVGLLRLLHAAYQKADRGKNLNAFLYGADTLPPVEPEYPEHYGEPGSGLTVFRGAEQRYLLVKHAPYGGEHDHYDRLSIGFSAFGQQMALDLGTVPYSAPHHYRYFKNTATHNTVTVGESNQPPQGARARAFYRRQGEGYLDVVTDWTGEYQKPDTFVLCQWEEESYQGVSMERKILWKEQYFVDVFLVKGLRGRPADWMFHCHGEERRPLEGEAANPFAKEQPYSYFEQIRRIKGDWITRDWVCGDGAFRLHSFAQGMEYYALKGPDNPPLQLTDFTVIRARGQDEAVFISVMEAYREQPLVQSCRLEAGEDGKLYLYLNGEAVTRENAAWNLLD